MSDLISREAVLEFEEYVGEPATWDKPYPKGDLYVKSEIIERIPSAEPQWILISERLPEEKKDVLIAFKHNMAVGFWEDILDNGEPAWYANSGDGWMTGTTAVDSDGIPIAWMPLPEPPKVEGEQNG